MLLSLPCKGTPESATQSGFESALSLSLGTFPQPDNRRHLLTHRVSSSTAKRSTSTSIRSHNSVRY